MTKPYQLLLSITLLLGAVLPLNAQQTENSKVMFLS